MDGHHAHLMRERIQRSENLKSPTAWHTTALQPNSIVYPAMAFKNSSKTNEPYIKDATYAKAICLSQVSVVLMMSCF